MVKILPVTCCTDCPYSRWIDVNYSYECGLNCLQLRFKEIGVEECLKQLFEQCPLIDLESIATAKEYLEVMNTIKDNDKKNMWLKASDYYKCIKGE